MAEHQAAPGLRKRWSALRDDLVFLPKLDRMTVETQECELDVVEFVRVAPRDEEVMVPVAPDVPTADVRAYSDWSDKEEDQQKMWALTGTAIAGNRVTRACPHCGGSRRVTCDRCGGDGRVICGWCSGSGHRHCTSCGGSGRHTHTHTTTNPDGSTSTSTEWEICGSCGGSGRTMCMSCLGSGRVTCGSCGGSGEVTCDTCSPQGTVDVYIRRSFVEATVQTHILPVSLPEYPGPVTLPEGCVEIQPRDAATPFDSEADRAELNRRGIQQADSRIFFVRKASVTVHTVRDTRTGELSATFIDGEPEPILTVHCTTADPDWTPDRERYKALGASILYAVGPLTLGGFILNGQALIGIGAAAAALTGAFLLNRHPGRAFRMAFADVRCPRHYRTVTIRCPGCGKDLCHECLLPSVRCPLCGEVVSRAVTHLIEDGRWVAVQPLNPDD